MSSNPLSRKRILPEASLPDPAQLIDAGRQLGAQVQRGSCAFLDLHGVSCELEYKRRTVAEGRVMFQAQVGYRDIDKTERACLEIHERLARSGYVVDRFGLIFDRSMGYPSTVRGQRPQGTGLIVEDPQRLAQLTANVPVAPHFGDHMIGPPASVENTLMAFEAGSTSLGNLAQYYSFDLLYEGGHIPRTEATITAIALAASQPVEVIIHSNIEDSFAPLFTDLCCSLGMVLVEQHIVGNLLGATLAHSFGQSLTNPLHRIAFQRALLRVEPDAGTMVYGNTTDYGPDENANYVALSAALTADLVAQRLGPSLHAIVPVPLSEFSRIPEPDEIATVHEFANRLREQLDLLLPVVDLEAADAIADTLVAGGEQFKKNLMEGFEAAGIDTGNVVETLLSLKRLGAKRLEALFGPGEYPQAKDARRRTPLLAATAIATLERRSDAVLAELSESVRAVIAARRLVGCVATTDVHEWGKQMLERVLEPLGVDMVDGGVNADPDTLADLAMTSRADFIALSTYNGIALTYMQTLRKELDARGLDMPVFVGGRLNQVPEGSNTSLPVVVTAELRALGAIPCSGVEQLLEQLAIAPRSDGCRS